MKRQLNLYYSLGGLGVEKWLANALILWLAILPVTAGCTKVGPDFETPVVPEEETWIEESDPKIDKGPVDNASWWRIFNDPVINKLVAKAYKENLTLQTAGLRVLEARARLGIAIGGQYPQVQEANGSLSADRLSRNAPNSAGANRSFSSASVGLDASWEIDFWGKFQRGIESADAQLGATVAGYDNALVTLTADVANSYILIRAAEEQIHFAEQNVKVQIKGLELAEAKYENGATSKLDVAQARALLNETKARIPGFESDRRQAQNALAVLLGTTPRQLPVFLNKPGKIPSPPKEVAIGIPADLIRRRPDIRQAEMSAAAQSARIGIAQADLYPRFSLAGMIGFETSGGGGMQSNNADLTDLFDSDSFATSIGPSFTIPLFNYGRITNNVRAQDARYQQLLTSYQNQVLEAYAEVENGIVGFLRALEQAQFYSESVKALQEAVVLSLIQYQEGESTYERVLDSQGNLVNVEDDWVESRSAAAQNLIATYKALGGGWEIRGADAFVPEKTQEIMRQRTDWGNLLPSEDLKDAPLTTEEVKNFDTLFRRPDW
jgi:NodT family efflux transporter outer membrane factor (OMF) lipoprotein